MYNDEPAQIMVKEGSVSVEVPFFENVSSKAPVFYNPAMELNRDLSVLALQVFRNHLERDVSICDAFGGTGIRGIRYAREIKGVKNVVINDLNPLAAKFAENNVHLNHLSNIEVVREDANILFRRCPGRFQILDIDPFGTPAPYIESAAISIKPGGMLCVTATDTSSLCGTYKEPCIRKYGSMPLKNEYCHENGLRILAGFISRTFAKYKKFVQVLFSHSTQHYLRLYLTIGKGAKETDESLQNLGFIAHCDQCLNRLIIPGIAPQIPIECPLCSRNLKIGGPLWIGTLLQADFIQKMMELLPHNQIKKEKDAFKLLERCYEESKGPVTFFDLHKICKKLKISVPPQDQVLERLEGENYIACRTHIRPTGIKTDAPIDVLKTIVVDLKK